MTRPFRPSHVPQGALDLYDRYAHGLLDRRGFFDGLGRFAVGGLTVAALAEMILPDYAEAQQTVAGDPRLYEQDLDYHSARGAGAMRGYLARPSGASEPLPGVVIIHENRGLNPHIRDVTRRVALAGYVALAPDALFPLGGYPGSDDDGRALQATRDRLEMLEDFMAAAEALHRLDACSGKVACVGFCFGGAIANLMALRQPWLSGAVPFYGGWPEAGEAVSLRVPLQVHLAELDTRVNAGWPAYRDALTAAGKPFEVFVYDGANHGFHNDTTPRFDRDAASLAWSRTLNFFGKVFSDAPEGRVRSVISGVNRS